MGSSIGTAPAVVGARVHYVSLNGDCWAATVTEVDGDEPTRVGLRVAAPWDAFSVPLVLGGAVFDGDRAVLSSWHWPCESEVPC